MIYTRRPRRNFYKSRANSWDASTIESIAFSTVPTKLIKREVMRERSVQEFLIRPSEFKAFGTNTLGFTVQGTGTSLVNRAVTVDDTADLQRDVSIRGFFKDLASGRLLEDGSSPFDFLRAIRNGEVLNDILGVESRNEPHSNVSSNARQEGNEESENEEDGGKGRLLRFEARISGTIQDQEKENSADVSSRIAERKLHGVTLDNDFSHLTKWRMLESAKCRILESHSSPLGFLKAMQNGDIWSNIQKGNTANESGRQHCGDHEHGEAVEVPTVVPEVNPDIIDSTENHGIRDIQIAVERECVHMDPVCPANSQKRKPRHTTVVKEFGVQKSRLLGPRRRVAHEITQSTPKPCMVVLSASKKAETKLKSYPKTKPAAPRKKDMSQSLSIFSVFSQRQNRCSV